jgi:nicotinamide mononucleotide adenylyltransferase
MANRGISWDPLVHSIQDLKEEGSKRLPKMYRGKYTHIKERFFNAVIYIGQCRLL